MMRPKTLPDSESHTGKTRKSLCHQSQTESRHTPPPPRIPRRRFLGDGVPEAGIGGCKEPPPRRTWSVHRSGLSPWFGSAHTVSRHRRGPVGRPVVTRPSPFLPSALRPTTTGPWSPLLPLHRRGGCRGNYARRLLDDLQPQLACLPLQRLELLLPHLRLVVLLTLTHVRHPMLQRQVDDPC